MNKEENNMNKEENSIKKEEHNMNKEENNMNKEEHNINKEENNMNNNELPEKNIFNKTKIFHNIDKYEFYSYVFYMYGYGLFYLFIFEQPFLRGLFLNFIINIATNYFIDHNILKLITHKYWRNNLNDIAMPQLISCSSQLLTYTYNNYITIPVNLFIFYLIDKIYKREIVYSRNIRVVLLFIYLLCNIFL
jgi:flagellar biosynthesis GTPase FlhF